MILPSEPKQLANIQLNRNVQSSKFQLQNLVYLEYKQSSGLNGNVEFSKLNNRINNIANYE